jgi:hypothetical protein
MNFLHKLNKAAVTLVVLATGILGTGNAFAAGTGQINGGNIYRIKNLTQNTAFANPATANACDTLQYRARLFNPGSGDLSNVMAEVSLSNEVGTSNTSTIMFTSTNADPVTTSAQATVNLTSAQSVSYVKGSAQLLDSDTNFVKSLPDSITQMRSGVNVGNLTASQLEFVQFQAKVNCPTTPPVKPPVTPPVTPPATTTTTTPAAPTTLVNTGPGDVAAIAALTAVAGTIGYRLYLSRRLSRQ